MVTPTSANHWTTSRKRFEPSYLGKFISALRSPIFQKATRDQALAHSFLPSKKLSDRELEIFHLIGQGLTTSQLAEQLRLSVKTIETHKANIKGKLNLKSGNELQVYAINWGLDQF